MSVCEEDAEGDRRHRGRRELSCETKPAMTAHRQAVEIVRWARDNEQTFGRFETAVRPELQRCIYQGAVEPKSLQSRRIDMIRKFLEVRTSESFCHLWKELSVAAIGSSPEPSFFQEATDRVFQEIITAAFPLKDGTIAEISNPEPETLTYEDANVVRYIAGYVCRKIRKNIEVSSRSNKQQLLSCVEGLLGDDSDAPSADWVDVVDRGGLLHIKEGTYMLFYAVEEEVREHFHLRKISQ